MSRTPSASAHKKVLQAALQLVAEQGIEATSMDAIARTSGVSKATIYKHWADKDGLMLEMLAEANGLNNRPCFDTGNVRRDMAAVLGYRPPEDCGHGLREKLGPQFAAYSATNKAFGMAWRNVVMEPPRKELRLLLKRGIENGDLDPSLDVEVSLALLLGPILYWFIFLRRTEENPQDLADAIVDNFWRAWSHARTGYNPKRR
jgi:AcrR family transcriptional regulator